MSEKVNNISQLHPFEEVIGVLHELIEDGGVLVARIGEICVALPWELEERINGLIGHKIGVLRTDLLEKPYLMRALVEDMNCKNKELVV